MKTNPDVPEIDLPESEIRERIRELEAEVARKEQAIKDQDVLLKKLSGQHSGWLILTPLPAYDGVMYGIQFRNGMCFLPADQRVPHFEHPPTKESYFVKMGISPEEALAIREREASTNSAMRAVHALRDDFGYQVEYFGEDQAEELKARMSTRLAEAGQALADESESLQQASLAQSGRVSFLGGS